MTYLIIYFVINIIILAKICITDYSSLLREDGTFDGITIIAFIILLVFWLPFVIVDLVTEYLIKDNDN